MSIKSSSVGSRQKVDSTPGKEVRNDGRAIMSRLSETSVLILKNLTAGKTANGCLVCCNSPSCCAICSVCPCCDYSEYLVKRRESSKYIHIRENSIEWNTPEISMRSGNCFGIDPCIFDVKDNVEVIYYDDPIFSRLKNTTRLCNEFRTCFCGGRGERIQLSSNCCFGMGYRGSCLCPCIPVCCPAALCPCAHRHVIYLEDAEQGIYAIKEAMKAAGMKNLYLDDEIKTKCKIIDPGSQEYRVADPIDR